MEPKNVKDQDREFVDDLLGVMRDGTKKLSKKENQNINVASQLF